MTKSFGSSERLCLSRVLRRKRSVKGQMFFIAAIFMVLGFVLLRSVLSLPVITQEKTFQEGSYIDRNLRNIVAEYENLAAAASAQPAPNVSAAGYFYNFSSYVRNDFDSRILYVVVFSNGTSQAFSVTIGNFMQSNVTGNISFAGATQQSAVFSMNDRTAATYNFTGGSSWVNVTLNYTLLGQQTVEKFYFNDSSRNYMAEFSDVSIRTSGSSLRSKNYYNRTW